MHTYKDNNDRFFKCRYNRAKNVLQANNFYLLLSLRISKQKKGDGWKNDHYFLAENNRANHFPILNIHSMGIWKHRHSYPIGLKPNSNHYWSELNGASEKTVNFSNGNVYARYRSLRIPNWKTRKN